MKIALTLLIAALMWCGCSNPPVASSSGRAIDLIQPGKAITWSNGTTVQVGKREGNTVEDIRVVGQAADGRETTLTARTGTLQSGSIENPEDRHCVRLSIPEAQGLHAGSRFVAHNILLTLTR